VNFVVSGCCAGLVVAGIGKALTNDFTQFVVGCSSWVLDLIGTKEERKLEFTCVGRFAVEVVVV